MLNQLAETIQNRSETPFLINAATGETLSYGQLAADVLAIFRKIGKAGVDDGCIGIMVRQPEGLIASVLACWTAGLTPAVIDPETSASRLDGMISTILPVAVIHDGPCPRNDLTCIGIAPEESGKPLGGGGTGLNFRIDPATQPCLLLFSSGTTGEPKCIPLSFNNITANISAFSELTAIDRDSVFLCLSPLTYAHGLYNSVLTAMVLGGKVVYGGVVNVLNAQKLLDAACAWHADIVHMTPSMMQILSLVGQRSQKPLPQFRRAICGTAKLHPKDKEAFERIFKLTVTQQYGMSEVLFISVNHDRQDEWSESVGIPVACDIKICGSGGEALGFNSVGNVHVKSQSAFGCYYYQPEMTEEAYDNGWFKTGDMGFLNPEGYLTITGRSKEIIKKGGIVIGPDEIDTVLRGHAGISESATIGVPDDVYGEEVYSFVVSSDDATEEQLRAHCLDTLPRTHIPKRVIFVNGFAKTASGKIIKNDLSRHI